MIPKQLAHPSKAIPNTNTNILIATTIAAITRQITRTINKNPNRVVMILEFFK